LTTLAATIIIAGLFAIQSIEEAQTIHITVQTNVGQTFSDALTNIAFDDTVGNGAVTLGRDIAGADGKAFNAHMIGTLTDDTDTDNANDAPTITIGFNDGDDFVTLTALTGTENGAFNFLFDFAGVDVSGQNTYRIIVDEGAGDTEADLDFVVVIEIVG